MTDWQRVAADFEEKYGVAQMWLDDAVGLLEAIASDPDVYEPEVDDFLERYEKEMKR